MADVKIAAETRTEFGKGAARRTRRAGKIPAVLYGHGTDPQHLSLPSIEFKRIVREQGRNAVLTLDIAGTPQLALTKTVVQHPIRPYIEHVDLLVIRRGEKVTVEVQIVVTGERRPGHAGQPGAQHRSRSRPTSRPSPTTSRSRSRARDRHADPGRRGPAARRARWSADPERSSSTSWRRRPRPTSRPRSTPRAPASTRTPSEAEAAARRGRIRPGRRPRLLREADHGAGPRPGGRARQPGPGLRRDPPQRRFPRSSSCWRRGPAVAGSPTARATPTCSKAGSAAAVWCSRSRAPT